MGQSVCPTCGSPVSVVGGGEGTNHYEPVTLSVHEARALRLAAIFGTPDPTPPEIASALEKIRAIEKGQR
jgi:hypothetical protein